jgi:hypothetical protein
MDPRASSPFTRTLEKDAGSLLSVVSATNSKARRSVEQSLCCSCSSMIPAGSVTLPVWLERCNVSCNGRSNQGFFYIERSRPAPGMHGTLLSAHSIMPITFASAPFAIAPRLLAPLTSTVQRDRRNRWLGAGNRTRRALLAGEAAVSDGFNSLPLLAPVRRWMRQRCQRLVSDSSPKKWWLR